MCKENYFITKCFVLSFDWSVEDVLEGAIWKRTSDGFDILSVVIFIFFSLALIILHDLKVIFYYVVIFRNIS